MEEKDKNNDDLLQQNQDEIKDNEQKKVDKNEDTEHWRKIGVKAGENKTTKKYEKQIKEWKEQGLLIDPENQVPISKEEYEKFQEILTAQDSGKKESDIDKLKKEYDQIVKKKEKQYMDQLKKEKEELEKLKEEKETILKSSQQEKKRHAVINELANFGYKPTNAHAQKTIIETMIRELGFDEDGKVIVVDKDGDEIVSPKTGENMTVQELLEKKYSDSLKYCFDKQVRQMDTGITGGNVGKGTKDLAMRLQNMSSEEYKEWKKKRR